MTVELVKEDRSCGIRLKDEVQELNSMNRDILAVIQENMPTFSKGQKRIANYILESYDKAAFMTASKLGKTVNVSESTVVRFASELGYDGYPSMQKSLQKMIRNRLTAVQRIEVSYDRFGDQDVLTSVLQSDIEKIRLTLEEIDHQSFDKAVDAIVSARKLYIIGVRSAASIATFLHFYFNLIFDNVVMVAANTSSEVFENLIKVGPDDVVIGVSFPRYSSRTVRAMSFARDRGATTISITDSEASPLAPISTYTLKARSDMASFVDSLVAPLSLVNALLVAVSRKKNEELANTFRSLEQIWEEYGVYEKVQD
jgi:DNA-binding MurR/RpiR family transcriptional regulator